MNDDRIDALTVAINRLADLVGASGQAPQPEVLDIRGVGQLLGITPKTVRKMDRLGELPAPLIIGARKKWRTAELRDWLAVGAPGREKWRCMAQR